jgi:hypothetical protein
LKLKLNIVDSFKTYFYFLLLKLKLNIFLFILGPLTFKNENGKHSVIGVVSFGPKTCVDPG